MRAEGMCGNMATGTNNSTSITGILVGTVITKYSKLMAAKTSSQLSKASRKAGICIDKSFLLVSSDLLSNSLPSQLVS